MEGRTIITIALAVCLVGSLVWGFISYIEAAEAEIALADAAEELEALQGEKDFLTEEVERWKIAFEQKPDVGSGLREFYSEQELVGWLEVDKTDEMLYISNLFDCDDFARMLQRNAIDSGYIISVILVTEEGESHAKNSTLIGNEIYYIEPQTDEVTLFCHTDWEGEEYGSWLHIRGAPESKSGRFLGVVNGLLPW